MPIAALGFGVPELLIILAIVFIIFGAGKLPQVGSALGRTIREFKKGVASGDEEAEKPAEKQMAKSEAKKEETPSGKPS